MAPDLVRAAADVAPGALALDDGADFRMAYGDLEERVSTVAAALVARGVAPGDRVVLLTRPRAEQVVWIHAIWRAQGVVVPLHPRSTGPEVGAALTALTPALVLAEAATVALVSGEAPVADVDALQALDGEVQPRAGAGQPTRGGEDVAAIVWTSGTAGRPRGVALPWRALAFNAEASRLRLGLRADDRWYASLSLAHVGGLVLVARAAALRSAVVLPGPFDASDLLSLGDDGRITHASLVPVMLERVLEARGDASAPPALRALLLGGGAAPSDLIERACRRGFPVAPTYGLTEATSQVATATPVEACGRPGAVGAPLPGVEVRLAADGEILVRGPSLAAGYVGDGGPMLGADGWLHTGDLGALEPDGALKVVGRRGDRVITGGVSVDPLEVEDALRRIDGIAGACVLGVPDSEWGERLVALIELEAGARNPLTEPGRTDAPDTLQDLVRARLRTRLQPAKIPKEVRVVDRLPRNRNGKLDRAAARRVGMVEGAGP